MCMCVCVLITYYLNSLNTPSALLHYCLTNTHTTLHKQVSWYNIPGQVSAGVKSWYNRRQTHHNADDGAEMILQEKYNGAEGVVLTSVLKARDRADELVERLADIDDEADKDAFLLQVSIMV